MAKMMSPNETIWWVPSTTDYDPDVPSAALLTDIENISCAVVTGYTLNPTASDTDGSASICDNANVATLTYYNYEASITFFREGDLLETDSDYAKVFDLFRSKGAQGYLVRRVGYASTVPAAAGQEVSSFKVLSDVPQDVVTDANIQMTVAFLPQGKMSLNKTLVA